MTDQATTAWRSERCPRCNSPDPARHPAVQSGGEVQVCPNEWHTPQATTDGEGSSVGLLPCPFCGNDVASQGFWYGCAPGDEPRGYHVFCLECGETDALDGPRRDTLEEAIIAWNTRAQPRGEGTEAVAWQRRMRNINVAPDHPWAPWSSWKECSEAQRDESLSSGGLLSGFPELRTQIRPVYAHPSGAEARRYPESEGEVPPCDGCGGSTRYWHATNRLWNVVMGGPEAKGDPGGVLCPNCFIDRAATVGEGRRWVVSDTDPDAGAEAPSVVGADVRQAIERLEWRRNARELGATKEALDCTTANNRAAYKVRVLQSASCVVDYVDLALVLAALSSAQDGSLQPASRASVPSQTEATGCACCGGSGLERQPDGMGGEVVLSCTACRPGDEASTR